MKSLPRHRAATSAWPVAGTLDATQKAMIIVRQLWHIADCLHEIGSAA